MSENASLPFVALSAVVVVLALTMGVAWHAADLGSTEVAKEVFAASTEVFMEACVAGGIIWWFQRRQAVQAKKIAIARDLRDIHEKVSAARFLMSAHKSGKSWVEQSKILIAARATVVEIQFSIKELRGTGPATAKSRLSRVESALRDIGEEYLMRHEDVDRNEREFQKRKDAGERPNLSQHWEEMLQYLPQTCNLVLNDMSRLFSDLRDASQSIETRRRRPGEILSRRG